MTVPGRPVPPALTAAEWAARRVDRFTSERGRFGAELTARGLELAVGWEDSGDDAWRVWHPVADLPALMALANAALPYGHPHQLNRGDVRVMREILDYCRSRRVPEDWMAERLADVAAKLAALLPPEGA